MTLRQPHPMGHDLRDRVIEFLREQGLKCYIAGGYVRAWLLGQPTKDIDVVVSGGAAALARRLADATGGAFYVLDEETDAARIVYPHPESLVVDVAAMRGPDILTDLRARDFTINAMAIDVKEYYEKEPSIIDPCDGRRDLDTGILRATGANSFRQDPVRLLRAVRFLATLGLQLDEETEAWLRRDAALVVQCSAERLRQELAFIVGAIDAAHYLRQMDELGLLVHILPEVKSLQGARQSAPHIHDVYEHTLATVAQAERLSAFPDADLRPEETDFLGPFAAPLGKHFAQVLCEQRTRSLMFKFAALLHDIGKPAVQSKDTDGCVPALGHEGLSAEMANAVLARLRFSASEIRLVTKIVANHMQPGRLLKSPQVKRKAIYCFFRDTGDAGVDVVILALAHQLATRGPNLRMEHWRDYLRLTRLLLEHYFWRPTELVNPPRLVSGEDVKTLLCLAPGPEVGQLLEAVREAQADGMVHTREEALRFLRDAALKLPTGADRGSPAP